MMKYCFYILIIVVSCLGCANESPSTDEAITAEESADALLEESPTDGTEYINTDTSDEGAAAAFEQSGGGEVADAKWLGKALPTTVLSLPQVKSSATTNGSMGFSVTEATAIYKKDKQQITLNITDAGLAGPALLAIAAWASEDIDKKSADGYERTSVYQQMRCYEKFHQQNNFSEFSLLYRGRFVIKSEGMGLTPAQTKAAALAISLPYLDNIPQ